MNEITDRLFTLIDNFYCKYGEFPTVITLGSLIYNKLQFEANQVSCNVLNEPHIITFNGIYVVTTKDNPDLIALGIEESNGTR